MSLVSNTQNLCQYHNKDLGNLGFSRERPSLHHYTFILLEMPSSSKQTGSSSSKSTNTTSAGQSGKGAGSQGGSGVSKEFAESYG